MKKYITIFFSLILGFSSHLSQNLELTNSIVVGGVTSNSARFWLRTSVPEIVNIELSQNLSFSETIIGTGTNTTIESDNSAIIEVSGLNSNTKYYYRAISGDSVIDNEERSFWTYPSDNSENTFSFAFGSCQQNGPFETPVPDEVSIFNEIVKHELRFFLQLGDWGYPDTTDNFPDDNNFFAADYNLVRKSYQNKYNKNYFMDQLFKKMPVDYVYDDHDYMNNNSSALTSSYYVPYRPNEFSQDDFVTLEIPNPAGARENSIRGYKENFPGYDLANDTRGIYHKFRFGNIEISKKFIPQCFF